MNKNKSDIEYELLDEKKQNKHEYDDDEDIEEEEEDILFDKNEKNTHRKVWVLLIGCIFTFVFITLLFVKRTEISSVSGDLYAKVSNFNFSDVNFLKFNHCHSNSVRERDLKCMRKKREGEKGTVGFFLRSLIELPPCCDT